jgi:nucleoside-diphosphate-sugar epimerase
MRVLMTGATGLIGRPVLDRLLERGDEVTVLALEGTADELPPGSALTVVTGSVEDAAALEEAAEGAEVVYHLAGLLPGSPPAALRRVNVGGTRSVLGACGSAARRFVFVSSVAVYRPAPWPYMWPVSENAPRAAHGRPDLRAYGQTKIDAEDAVRAHCAEHGIEHVIVRPPTAYGAGATFITDLVEQVLAAPRMAGSRIARMGAMQWVHTEDLAEGIVLAGTREGAAGQTFNIAGGQLITVPRLLATIRRIQRPKSAAAGASDDAPDGYHTLRFDISAAQRVLGYVPTVRLSEGLREVLPDLELAEDGVRILRRPRRRRGVSWARPWDDAAPYRSESTLAWPLAGAGGRAGGPFGGADWTVPWG